MRPICSAVLLLGLQLLQASCVQEQAPLPPPPKPALELIGEWGTPGDGPGQLSRPVSIAADFAGNVYIADAGSKYIHKFDPSGKPLLSFQDVSLKSPGGIAVDEGGGIYVTDTAGNQLLIFKPDGERFARIRRAGNGLLSGPSGVAVASDGTFYVTDLDGTRVTRYEGRLRPIYSWRLPEPAPVQKGARADVATGPDGSAYVTHSHSPVVYATGAAGPGDAPLRVFAAEGAGSNGVAQGPLVPAKDNSASFGLSVSERHVFLVDAGSGRLTVWSVEGKPLLDSALPAAARSENPPAFVDVVWSARRELFVLEQAGARVLRFRVNF